MNEILVTDTLFISANHEQQLQAEGYSVVRLPKPRATADELREAIKGKVGYILGGVEQLTADVLDAADSLRAIAFTGAGYTEFIPAHDEATRRGIAISNAPGGNAQAMAEYALTISLAMTRRILELGRTGTAQFMTTPTLRDLSVGVVGLGHTGMLFSLLLDQLGVREVRYYSKSRKYHLEAALNVTYLPLDELLGQSDIVSLHISKHAGVGFIGSRELDLMRDGALLVNAAYPQAVDFAALRSALLSGHLRAAFDAPPEGDWRSLPQSAFFTSNAQTAFNTFNAIETVSSMSTRSILNLLRSGDDLFLVNPDYRAHSRR